MGRGEVVSGGGSGSGSGRRGATWRDVALLAVLFAGVIGLVVAVGLTWW